MRLQKVIPATDSCAAAKCSLESEVIDATGRLRPGVELGFCWGHWKVLCDEPACGNRLVTEAPSS